MRTSAARDLVSRRLGGFQSVRGAREQDDRLLTCEQPHAKKRGVQVGHTWQRQSRRLWKRHCRRGWWAPAIAARGMRLWHGTNAVPKPERAGGTGEGQKPMGANFITDPHNEVMGGAREYITSKRFSSISRAQEDNRTGRELLGSNQCGILGKCVIWPTGGRGSAVFLVQLIPFVKQLGNVRSSAQRKIGFTVELRNRTICFLQSCWR